MLFSYFNVCLKASKGNHFIIMYFIIILILHLLLLLLLHLLLFHLNYSRADEPYPSKACALLDKYPNEFDPVEVLRLLPPTIPLHILKNFLTYSLKHKTHKYVLLLLVLFFLLFSFFSPQSFFLLSVHLTSRMHHAQVLKNVTASQHMTYQLEKMELEQQKTFITYNTLCTVTGQPIRKMPFVRYFSLLLFCFFIYFVLDSISCCVYIYYFHECHPVLLSLTREDIRMEFSN
jgi:hypothetical protein